MQTGSGRRRRFAITVDGVRHEVIVEELPATDSAMAPSTAAVLAPAAGVPSTAGAPPTPDAPSPGTPGTGGLVDGWVPAPMPGTVTEVWVQAGDRVQTGDVLLVLTAMKMENEITAPTTGIVKTVGVTEGATVNSGDPLVQLAPEEG